jgi:hypothetical protein
VPHIPKFGHASTSPTAVRDLLASPNRGIYDTTVKAHVVVVDLVHITQVQNPIL